MEKLEIILGTGFFVIGLIGPWLALLTDKDWFIELSINSLIIALIMFWEVLIIPMFIHILSYAPDPSSFYYIGIAGLFTGIAVLTPCAAILFVPLLFIGDNGQVSVCHFRLDGLTNIRANRRTPK